MRSRRTPCISSSQPGSSGSFHHELARGFRPRPKTQPLHQLLHLILRPTNKRKRNRIPPRQHHHRRLAHHPRPHILLKIPPHHSLSPDHKLIGLLDHRETLSLSDLCHRPEILRRILQPRISLHTLRRNQNRRINILRPSIGRPRKRRQQHVPATTSVGTAALSRPIDRSSTFFRRRHIIPSIHLLSPQNPRGRNPARESKCGIAVDAVAYCAQIQGRTAA